MKHFNVTFLLTILFLMVGAKAFAYDAYIDGICYNYSGGNATVTYMNVGHYSGTIVIPASVTYSGKTYNVTSIGDRAFYGCRDLTSITIPESVKSIGDNAFNGCSSLTSITIPESVTSIGDNAFLDCRGLTSITIFEGVTSIGSSAFHGTAWYNNQPDGLIYVGNIVYKFKGTMPNNTSIELKEDTKGIAGSAFEGCCGLTSITIPESVTSIGDNAFLDCRGLTSITIPEGVTSIGILVFGNCSGLNSITIPEGVTSIGEGTFYNCSGLNSITIPESVTSIGDAAFYNCSGLNSITIPESVTSIGDAAFHYCSSLTSINIPKGVTSISNYAFLGCKNLTSITISEGVTSIGSSAFSGCSGLEQIKVLITDYASFCNNKVVGMINSNNGKSIQLIDKEGDEIKAYLIPKGVTSIGEYAFRGCCGLTSITIPEGVTSIGSSAFEGCSGLTSITIPESVTSIGSSAFEGCCGLTSITIFEGMTNIGSSAFEGCSDLSSITIPKSVTSIGSSAFEGCSGLTSITIFEGVTSIGSSAFHGTAWYNNQPDGLIYVGNIVYKFKGTMPNNTSIELKEDTKGIAGSAFEGCCGLTSISMPEGVTSIGDQAFDGCSSLTSIAIPESVMSIGNSAFRDCSCLTSIIINLPTVGSWFSGLHSIKEVQLGKKVTTIGDSAFYGSTLYSLIVGSGVQSISPSAFSSKPTKTIWLTNTPPEGYETAEGMVNYAANEQYASLTNNTVYPFLSSMFEVDGIRYVPVSPSERICDAIDCLYSSSATNVHIGKTVDFRGIQMSVKVVKPYTCYQHPYLEGALLDFEGNLGENAFYGCTSLKEVTIDNKGDVGEQAFYGCKSLTAVTIDNKGDVGEQAFYGCKSLTDVSAMNDGKIGKSAFSGCTALEKVIIKNNGDIGSRAFYGCSSLEDVTISNNGDIGKEAFYESSINGKLVISNEGFIGISAFSNIEGGVDVIINNAKSIQPSSFANSFGLNTLELGERITTIGNQAFKDCKNLRSIRDLHKGGIAGEAFANCFSLQTVTLGDSITSLGKSAFRGCSALQEIKLPDAVQTLGSSAFQDCTSLTSVDMGNGVGAIAGSAFLGCSALTDIRVGRQVQSIGTNAFSGCSSLPQIVLPQSVESIGDYVFQGCKSLKAMVMEELSDDAASSELSLGSNGSSPLFADCPLDSVFIGRNITYSTASSEGYSPFYRNTSLRAVTITDKETEISPNEFYGCTNLKNVRIGDGVERIGDWAFSGCSSLEYFAFGARVKNIGTEAFSDCNSVTQIISRAITPPACGAQALDDINKWNCKLIVPQGKLKDYQAADQWKDFFFAEEVDMGFTHKLTYMVDGEEYKTCDYEFGMSIVPEDTPTKEGYTFSGWIGLPQMMPNQDVIVTGSFTINQYSVKFIVDGEVISEQKLDFGSVITVPENPAKEGYTFSGWSDIPEIVPAIDVVIYGSFAVNKYILIYMLDGEEYKKVSVDYGTSLTAEEAPKKEGYTFSGWNDVPTTMPAHDVTVIGSFTVNTYMVRYYVGDQLIAEDEVEYGAEVVLRDYTSDDASRYSFAGWEGEVYATMPAHDIEYHAIIVDFIVDMSGTSNHVQAIYDTNGRKLTKPQRGVNILLMRDGSKRKLVVK